MRNLASKVASFTGPTIIGRHSPVPLLRFESWRIVMSVIKGEGATTRNRELIGLTDAKKVAKTAAEGTIRGHFGIDVARYTVRGLDPPETVRVEIA